MNRNPRPVERTGIALDGETEAAVMHSINALNRDLTVVMVAHRHSTLANCDIVFEITAGTVTRSGSLASAGSIRIDGVRLTRTNRRAWHKA